MNTLSEKIIVITSLILFAGISACEKDKNPASDINNGDLAVLPLPESYHYHAIQFLDQNQGWVIGDNGIILHTSNGGKTWTKQESNTTDHLMKIQFIDSECGWIAGTGSILHTDNGGQNWTEQLTDSQLSMFADIYFINNSTGWASGPPGGIVYSTVNGGKTWDKKQTGDNGRIHSLSFIDNDAGYAVAASSSIYKTITGGSSWIKVKNTGDLHFCYTIYFIDLETGFAGNMTFPSSVYNERAYIFRTDDGGTTWIKQEIPDSEIIIKIFFLTHDTGWAIAGDLPESGKLLYTQNGGQSWTETVKSIEYSNQIVDFSAIDENLIYALTITSQIYKINL